MVPVFFKKAAWNKGLSICAFLCALKFIQKRMWQLLDFTTLKVEENYRCG